MLRVLDEELRRLPQRYQSPLLLCYLEGRTQDEAAKQLNWSLSTLRRRLEAGRELLRGRMVRRGATLGAGLFASILSPSAIRATLTAELRQAVLNTGLAGAKGIAVPASITLLANGGMRLAMLTKIALASVLVLVMGGGVAGLLWQTQLAPKVEATPQAPAAKAPAAKPAKEPAIRRDRFNDPLPKGAIARAGTVAFRHGRIFWGSSLTFTPDGKHLISAGGGWVRRWDLATGHATINLGDGFRDGNGGTALVASDGKLVRLGLGWRCTEHELESGKERTYKIQFPSRGNDAHAMPEFLSPDGKTFAELTHRGALTLWNASDGTFTHYLKPEGVTFTALAFPPDGKTVVVGDEEHTFRVIDRTTGKELRSFGILNANVVARMAISPDGKWLVTAGGQKGTNPMIRPHDRFVRLWNLKEGNMVRTLDFPEDYGVRSLRFTPDSRTLIAGIQGGKSGSPQAVRAWDIATGKPGRAWTDDPTIGLTLAVSPDGKTLATLSQNGVIRLWNWKTGKEQHLLEASPCSLDGVGFRPDGKTLLTFGDDCILREWEAATGQLLASPRALRKRSYWPRFSASGQFLVTAFLKDDGSNVVRLYDPASGKVVLEQPGSVSVVSPKGERMAIRGKDDRIRILDLPTGKLIQTLTPPAEERTPDGFRSFPRGFTPDSQSLIVLGETLSVWDVRTAKQKTSWNLWKNNVLEKKPGQQRHSWERIESVALSPDGAHHRVQLAQGPAEKEASP